MKIIHICLTGPYTINWGYQENILPKYHHLLGHEVSVISTCNSYDDVGNIIKIQPGIYSENGVKVLRVQENKRFYKIHRLFSYYNIYSILRLEKPDFVMIHGLMTYSSICVAKYKKRHNKNLVIVADTHADFYNSKSKGGFKFRLLMLSFVILNKWMSKYYRNIYAMTPDCKKFANFVYKVPLQKMNLLPLGVDDKLMIHLLNSNTNEFFRKKYNISGSDIVITTGGKLNPEKNIHLILDAFNKLQSKNVKLVIFGESSSKSYAELLKEKSNSNVIYTGQLSLEEIYVTLISSDVIVFAGTQSVLWQQAISAGKPLIIKRWPSIEYLDFGGNLLILDIVDALHIYESLQTLINSNSLMIKMSQVAKDIAFKKLAYSNIASIILNNTNWED
jgi:glycosyltransferase involved in cell wall biosynthesis